MTLYSYYDSRRLYTHTMTLVDSIPIAIDQLTPKNPLIHQLLQVDSRCCLCGGHGQVVPQRLLSVCNLQAAMSGGQLHDRGPNALLSDRLCTEGEENRTGWSSWGSGAWCKNCWTIAGQALCEVQRIDLASKLCRLSWSAVSSRLPTVRMLC